MKPFFVLLCALPILPCAADISITPQAAASAPAVADVAAQKQELLEALKLIADEKAAAAAVQQLEKRYAALLDMQRRYDSAVQQTEAQAQQADAALQQEMARVAALAEGANFSTDKEAKHFELVKKHLQQQGTDTSAVHEIDNRPARVPTSEAQPPSLRPLPPGLNL